MDIQRLRNLTTGVLHTKMEHIYKDLEEITREDGIMTHMLPRINDAIEPWLREHVTESRFWDDKYDPSHTGEYDLPVMSEDEKKVVFTRYMGMPNPLVREASN